MPRKNQIDPAFWKGKKVFVTGHTGFKGTWLSIWLSAMGAHVTGYALPPPTEPSLYGLCRMEEIVTSHLADIRHGDVLTAALLAARPDIVFHLAAQPLVRQSYESPVETYEVNMMGTVNLLEAVRQAAVQGNPAQAVIIVTTDKCYAVQEGNKGYRETDRLGGSDPYSSSKACAELITAGYRQAFFGPRTPLAAQVPIASVRAGNVIGGGDWAKDRLMQDSFRALLQGKPIPIRYPRAIRPWQHVLEPLSGYLLLAQRLAESGQVHAKAWNFGPDAASAVAVEQVVCQLCELWGGGATYASAGDSHPYEVHVLQLNSTKARRQLGWLPKWDLHTALVKTVDWMKAYLQQRDVREICLKQIHDYMGGESGDAR